MHTNIGVALQTNFYEFLFVECMYLFKYVFSSITLRILNLHNKSQIITNN